MHYNREWSEAGTGWSLGKTMAIHVYNRKKLNGNSAEEPSCIDGNIIFSNSVLHMINHISIVGVCFSHLLRFASKGVQRELQLEWLSLEESKHQRHTRSCWTKSNVEFSTWLAVSDKTQPASRTTPQHRRDVADLRQCTQLKLNESILFRDFAFRGTAR